ACDRGSARAAALSAAAARPSPTAHPRRPTARQPPTPSQLDDRCRRLRGRRRGPFLLVNQKTLCLRDRRHRSSTPAPPRRLLISVRVLRRASLPASSAARSGSPASFSTCAA